VSSWREIFRLDNHDKQMRWIGYVRSTPYLLRSLMLGSAPKLAKAPNGVNYARVCGERMTPRNAKTMVVSNEYSLPFLLGHMSQPKAPERAQMRGARRSYANVIKFLWNHRSCSGLTRLPSGKFAGKEADRHASISTASLVLLTKDLRIIL
jgi:hypothetical protein